MSVATLAIDLWQDFVTLIKEFLLHCASKWLQNALLKYHTDVSMVIKLSIFNEIASVLMGFLETILTAAHAVPFPSDCIERVLRQFLKYFVKWEARHQVITASQLVNFNVDNPEVNYLPGNVSFL